jgi:ABC-type nitrate/sulfonate/bicarbonate transport system substrate-binding protein
MSRSSTQSLLRGDGRILDWVVGGGEPFPTFEETMIVFNTDLRRRRPQAVKAFLAAELDAVNWIAHHEQGARAILVRGLGLTAEVGRKLNLPLFVHDARNSPEALFRIEQQLLAIEPGPAVRVRSLYDETLLNEILRK